jgi:hypothetical protein
MQQMFSSDFYFPSETSISIENPSNQYGGITQLGFFVEIYSLNNFLPKLVSSSQPVPEGKKWKVVNFLSSAPLTAPNQQAALLGGSNSIIINGFEVLSNGGDLGNLGSPSKWDIVRLAKGSFWIPEGTTLAPGANTYAVNVLEFDSSQSSTGGGSGGGISLGNECLNISDIGSGTITYSSPLSAQFENLNTRNIYTHFSITNNYPYGAIEVKCFDINDDLIPVLFSGTTNASFAGFGGSTTWASSDITQSTSVFNELFSQDLSFPSTGGSEYFSRSYAILINSDVTINKIEINFLDIEGGNFKANYRLYSRFCTP